MFFASCKEKAPNIILTEAGVVLDTTYVVSPVPPTDPHNVLMEEFTGASCTNCPAAHETLLSLSHASPGRINIVGLYCYNITQTRPPNGAVYDFRDSVATDVASSVFLGVSSLPSGGVDRWNNTGAILMLQGSWGSTIESRKNVVDSLNLAITSSYNAATREDTITATVTYTQTVAAPHNLSIVITEDSIIDVQEYPAIPSSPFPSGHDDEYVFTNVFRGMVTNTPYGDPILATMPVKEPGRVYRHIYIHKIKEGIKPEHCHVIAFINSTVDKSVMQSVQTKMKP